MKTRSPLLFLLIWLLASAAVVSGQSDDDGAAILRRVSERYRAFTNFDFKADVSMHIQAGAESSQSGRLHAAGVLPGRQYTRIDMGPGAGTEIVLTPDSTWTYMGSLNQYTVSPSAVSVDGDATGGGLAQYMRIDMSADGARVVRRESVRTSAGEHACAVIALLPDTLEMDHSSPLATAETLWVDVERDLVLKHVMRYWGSTPMGDLSMHTTFRYEEPDLVNPPPDSLFVFSPPAGAKRMASFDASVGSEVAKGPAHPFTLSDLAGKKVSLADCKGKVVMLDFWATWCGPCRIELPHVDVLSRELAGQGLVVFAVTQETREQAAKYLESAGIGLRCLIDADGKVNEAYGVRAIPSVVIIDRDGNISDYFVGVRSEADLRAAVKKAGIK